MSTWHKCDCGYKWPRGMSGAHHCAEYYLPRLAAKCEEVNELEIQVSNLKSAITLWDPYTPTGSKNMPVDVRPLINHVEAILQYHGLRGCDMGELAGWLSYAIFLGENYAIKNIVMPRALTAENGAKIPLIPVSLEVACPCEDLPDHQRQESCPHCHDRGSIMREVLIEITEEIYAKCVELLEVKP